MTGKGRMQQVASMTGATMSQSQSQSVALPNLLARFAEHSFWMARYVERADNLARVIDVNETFAAHDAGEPEWLPIVQLYADNERFFAQHDEASAANVLHFYILDRKNPSSLLCTIQAARENARSLRHLISTETWTHLNVFHNRLLALTRRDIALPKLSQFCAMIKENCQLHAGIVEGTGYRDQVWYLHQIGTYLERADQTTRLLDINYHRLLPSIEDVGSQIDASRWNALLRSVAGYHAFRRVHPRGMDPSKVADFLIFDPRFQRSISVCSGRIQVMLEGLRDLPEMARAQLPHAELASLCEATARRQIGDVLASGLHEFLDDIQQRIIRLTEALGDTVFGHHYARA